MKKGGRSLKGLFRPKSVVGVPSADASLHPSVGTVSLVNVEAEREQVNVNANPRDQPGGGTGFPKLEQNSLDLADAGISSRRDSQATEIRGSIVGGDAERAEVMSAVKRGILKRKLSCDFEEAIRMLIRCRNHHWITIVVPGNITSRQVL